VQEVPNSLLTVSGVASHDHGVILSRLRKAAYSDVAISYGFNLGIIIKNC
jgi:hypothetical protein